MRAVLTLLPAAADARAAAGAIRPAIMELQRTAAPVLTCLHRIEVPLATAEPLAWLAAHPAEQPLAWAARDGSLVVAGRGIAAARAGGSATVATGLQALESELCGGPPRLRWFGAVAFAPDACRGQVWRGFHDWQWLLPRIEVGRDGDGAWLAVHIVVAAGQSPEHATAGLLGDLAQLQLPERARKPWPRLSHRRQRPAPGAWLQSMAVALEQLRAGTLAKVVLARRTDLTFDAPVDPVALLLRLAAREPASFRFCLPCREGAFVGASPERLLAVTAPGLADAGDLPRSLATEAVAGTRPRGRTPHDDAALAAALLASTKDRLEHRLVVDGIAAALAPWTNDVQRPAVPEVLRCGRVQHLRTPLLARLDTAVGTGDLLAALHPTAAVCGQPTAAARDLLTRLEPFARGLYAAPVGWIGTAGAEFAVGIRSAVVRDRSVALFAGAGIVAASSPTAEWHEIDAKVASLVAALDADDGAARTAEAA